MPLSANEGDGIVSVWSCVSPLTSSSIARDAEDEADDDDGDLGEHHAWCAARRAVARVRRQTKAEEGEVTEDGEVTEEASRILSLVVPLTLLLLNKASEFISVSVDDDERAA